MWWLASSLPFVLPVLIPLAWGWANRSGRLPGQYPARRTGRGRAAGWRGDIAWAGLFLLLALLLLALAL